MSLFQKIREKRTKILDINEKLTYLEKEVLKEIQSFEDFKKTQSKKFDILKNIIDLWNRRWKEAEKVVKEYIPKLIQEQIRYAEKEKEAISEESFILNTLEKKDTACLLSDKELNKKIKGSIKYDVELVKTYFNKLIGYLKAQEEIFSKEKIWAIIKKNRALMEELENERALTGYLDMQIGETNNLILSELKKHKQMQELLKKEVYIGSVDSVLTIKEIKEALEGKIPIVFYHGADRCLEEIFRARCLAPIKRLDTLSKIRMEKNKKQAKEIIKEYKRDYRRDRELFKMVVLNREEILKHIQIGDSDDLIVRVEGKTGNPEIETTISQAQRKVFEALDSNSRKRFFSEIYPIINKYFDHSTERIYLIQLILIQKYNVDIFKEKMSLPEYYRGASSYPLIKKLYFKKASKKEIEKILNLKDKEKFQEYSSALKNKLGEDIFDKIKALFSELWELQKNLVYYGEEYDFLKMNIPIFDLRDKWYVFFGAEEPFKANETYSSICKKYTGHGEGCTFELKPTIYKQICWEEIELPLWSSGNVSAIPAATYNKMTHDLITKKNVNSKFWLRIYTSKENIRVIEDYLREYNISVPVLEFSQQKETYLQIMNELKQKLKETGLVSNARS